MRDTRTSLFERIKSLKEWSWAGLFFLGISMGWLYGVITWGWGRLTLLWYRRGKSSPSAKSQWPPSRVFPLQSPALPAGGTESSKSSLRRSPNTPKCHRRPPPGICPHWWGQTQGSKPKRWCLPWCQPCHRRSGSWPIRAWRHPSSIPSGGRGPLRASFFDWRSCPRRRGCVTSRRYDLAYDRWRGDKISIDGERGDC